MPDPLYDVHDRLTRLAGFLADPGTTTLLTRDAWLGAGYDRAVRSVPLDDVTAAAGDTRALADALGAYLRRGRDVLFVAVLGQLKAGKSSLLNRLLNADLQPTPPTPHPHDIELLAHRTDADAVRGFDGGGFASTSLVRLTVAFHDAAALAGVVLVDTPGAGETLQPVFRPAERDEFVRQFLPFCDLALCVVRPGQLSRIDADLLVRKEAELPNLPTVYVMTRADDFKPDKFAPMAAPPGGAENVDRVELAATVADLRQRLIGLVQAELGHLDDRYVRGRVEALRAAEIVPVCADRRDPWNVGTLAARVAAAAAAHRAGGGGRLHADKVAYFRRRQELLAGRVARFVADQAGFARRLLAQMLAAVRDFSEGKQLLAVAAVSREWAARAAEARRAGADALARLDPARPAPQAAAALRAVPGVAAWERAVRGRIDEHARAAAAALDARARPSLVDLLRRRGEAAALALDPADPTAVSVPAVTRDEVELALGVRSAGPVHLRAAPPLAGATDQLPVVLAAAVDAPVVAAADELGPVADAIGGRPAEALAREVARAEEYVRQDMHARWFTFYAGFRAIVAPTPEGHLPYQPWPAVHAAWELAHRPLSDADRDDLLRTAVDGLLPPDARGRETGEAAAGAAGLAVQLGVVRAELAGLQTGAAVAAWYPAARAALEADAAATAAVYAGVTADVTAAAVAATAARERAAAAAVAAHLRALRHRLWLGLGTAAGVLALSLVLAVAYLFDRATGEFAKIAFGLLGTLANAVLGGCIWLWSRCRFEWAGGGVLRFTAPVIEDCRGLIRAAFADAGSVEFHTRRSAEDRVRTRLEAQFGELLGGPYLARAEAAYGAALAVLGRAADLRRDAARAVAGWTDGHADLFAFGAAEANVAGVFNALKERVVAGPVELVRRITADWDRVSTDLAPVTGGDPPWPRTDTPPVFIATHHPTTTP